MTDYAIFNQYIQKGTYDGNNKEKHNYYRVLVGMFVRFVFQTMCSVVRTWLKMSVWTLRLQVEWTALFFDKEIAEESGNLVVKIADKD